MNAAEQKDLQTRVKDLENALKTIGKILLGENGGKLDRRVDRVMGILMMYDCAPAEKGVTP